MIGFIIENNGWTLEATTEEEAKAVAEFRAFLESKGISTEERFYGDGFFIKGDDPGSR